MRYAYDTEFLDDGRTIELISIGIVAEDGREFYAVNEAINVHPLHERIRSHQWLMANVIPHLPLAEIHPGIIRPLMKNYKLDDTSNQVMPLRMIRNGVREFIPAEQGPAELWAYYGAYDHVALAQLFGPMINLPGNIPMFTNDLKQEMCRRGLTKQDLPEQFDDEHHALADARWVMAALKQIELA